MKLTSAVGRAAVAGAALLASSLPIAGPANASSLPFQDPYSDGFITICNQQGHPVTSGDTRQAPFAWDAVSSSAAPTGYAAGLAYLYAFQPLQYVDPGDWNGEGLSGGSWYSNPEHPIAQSTGLDIPMLWFVQAYPARWDGYVELRMIYTLPGHVPDTSPYPTAIIQVTGYHWKLIQGGTTPCKVGTTRTLESNTSPAAELKAPHFMSAGPVKTARAGSAGSGPSGSSRASAVASGSQGGTNGPFADGSSALSSRSNGGGLSAGEIAGIAASVAVVFGGAVLCLLVLRRRRRLPASS